jgi:hypothetical protein
MKKSGHWLEISKDYPWSRSCQSELNPADPDFSGDGTLFKNSIAGKWCVACSVKTWEQSCVNNPKKIYVLSQEEQDSATSFLWCKKCGHYICNICANLFNKKLQSLTKRPPATPPWCKFVDCFLLKAAVQKLDFTMEIPSNLCFSCQHKDSLHSLKPQATANDIVPDGTNCSVVAGARKSKKKRRKLNDKYQTARKNSSRRFLDGALFFSEIGILIHSNVQHFDSLSIAKQVGCKKQQLEQGLLHMNVTPKNACVLEHQGFFPSGNPNSVEFHNADFIVSYPSPKDRNITINRLVEVIIIDSHKAAHTSGTKMAKGCDWISGSEMKRTVEYLDAAHIKRSLGRGIDIKRSDLESTQLYMFLTGLLSSAWWL